MKIIAKDIFEFQKDIFFAPLRTKVDYASLIVYSARNLLLDYDVAKERSCGQMKLIIARMSRLFFFAENHIFSVSFPFLVCTDSNKDDQDDLGGHAGNDFKGDSNDADCKNWECMRISKIQSYSGRELNNESISFIISILKNEKFELNRSLLDSYINSSEIEYENFLLLEEILQFEPAYIRYDNDPKNEKGKLHPLHHFDVNYSNYSTYKLGLDKAITNDFLENMLDVATECSYIR